MAALEMVGLETLGDRKPRALSGGQQQRVALARVLVTKPKALLLDEPLGDLDRLLQLRMRVELRNLQRQLGLMFIHVTHNQEEALSMADRIVVMNDARVQQIADPLTIATKPETEVVARFMGDNNVLARQGRSRATETGSSSRTTTASGPASSSRAGRMPLAIRPSSRARAAAVQLADGSARGRTPPRARSSSSSSSATSSSSISWSAASASWPRSPATVLVAPWARGRDGCTFAWDEEDVQLLRA